jgi:DNA-binding FrmR family transcriptional regulator
MTSTSAALHDPHHMSAAVKALVRIEGQCRGIQRMVAEERPCAEILQQVSAARNALDAVGYRIVICAIETELDDGSLSAAARRRLRSALTQVRKLR